MSKQFGISEMSNPYELGPFQAREHRNSPSTLERSAQLKSHLVLVILAIPMAYNLMEFWLEINSTNRSVNGGIGLVHLMGGAIITTPPLVVGFFIFWPLLNLASRILRSLFCYGVPKGDWNEVFYQSFNSMVLSVIGAALCWILFTFCFYRLRLSYIVSGNLAAIPAHIFMAYWYLPLFYNWYQLRKLTLPKTQQPSAAD